MPLRLGMLNGCHRNTLSNRLLPSTVRSRTQHRIYSLAGTVKCWAISQSNFQQCFFFLFTVLILYIVSYYFIKPKENIMLINITQSTFKSLSFKFSISLTCSTYENEETRNGSMEGVMHLGGEEVGKLVK